MTFTFPLFPNKIAVIRFAFLAFFDGKANLISRQSYVKILFPLKKKNFSIRKEKFKKDVKIYPLPPEALLRRGKINST